jgi:hypothetical protein
MLFDGIELAQKGIITCRHSQIRPSSICPRMSMNGGPFFNITATFSPLIQQKCEQENLEIIQHTKKKSSFNSNDVE